MLERSSQHHNDPEKIAMSLFSMSDEREEIRQEKLKRMTQHSVQKRFLFYPEGHFKMIWDVVITLALVVVCFKTPADIAFAIGTSWNDMSNVVIDSLFMLDILVIFNSAFYNANYDLIDKRNEIVQNYISGWFLIDLLAVIPIDVIVDAASSVNKLVRVTRVSRLYRLVKLS